jgi:hypothetical protein
MRRITIALLILVIVWSISACGSGGGGTPDPNAGFRFLTYAIGPNNVRIPTSANVNGQLLEVQGATTGTVESFNRNHSGVGFLIIQGARVPARWRVRIGPDFLGSLCLFQVFEDLNLSLNSQEDLECPGRFTGFTASPDSIDAQNPPMTIGFYGEGVNNLYGEPALAFYDELGNVVASTQAQPNQLFWSGPEIAGFQVTLPSISDVYDGVYTVVVHNIDAKGQWEVVGAAAVTIYGNPIPPPPPPPDDPGPECGQQSPDLPQLPCEVY